MDREWYTIRRKRMRLSIIKGAYIVLGRAGVLMDEQRDTTYPRTPIGAQI